MRRLLLAIALIGCARAEPPEPEPAPEPTFAPEPPPAPPPLPTLSEGELEAVLGPARAAAEAAGLLPTLDLSYTNDDAPTYQALAEFLSAHRRITRVRIAVHSDPRGSSEYNLRITQERADQIADALVDRGVACERLEPIGYGESRPIADAPMGAQRRTELILVRVDHTDVVAPARDACGG